jgi:hypothetical protein
VADMETGRLQKRAERKQEEIGNVYMKQNIQPISGAWTTVEDNRNILEAVMKLDNRKRESISILRKGAYSCR